MKKNSVFIRWIVMILCLTGLLFYLGVNKNLDEDATENDEIIKKVINVEENSKKIVKYMELEDKEIYLYGIEEIIMNNDKTLKEYIDANGIDEFINELNHVGDLNDGGTKIYKNDEIKVFLCKTISGSNDIYISLSKIDNEDGFNNGICEKNIGE